MKEAKLFQNGRSQAVRLPKEYRLRGKSVYIHKLGNLVVLIPKTKSWDSLVDACDKFTEDFMTTRNQGVHEREQPFG
ncbi:MAG: antitoxin [Candidatus Omnitrophica bacterium]|nr:antitoxin [Candidatus Omnitrophota bacterium]MBI3010104.1 antitoxin [Candidatus Omnitrophota bacterium]